LLQNLNYKLIPPTSHPRIVDCNTCGAAQLSLSHFGDSGIGGTANLIFLWNVVCKTDYPTRFIFIFHPAFCFLFFFFFLVVVTVVFPRLLLSDSEILNNLPG